MAAPPPPSDPSPLLVSRRALLRGATALGVLGTVGGLGLVACGDDDESGSSETGTTGGEAGGDLVLVSMLPEGTAAAGSLVRVPLGLGDVNGTLVRDAPARLTFSIEDVDGNEVVSGLEVPRHDAGLPRAYFPVEHTIDAPGFYTARSELDGTPLDAAFQVVDPGEVAIPQPGDDIPALTTPTPADPAGVDPICTAEPQCPLHEVELTSVLGTQPVALLISTPAFCQTAICGPVLDLFVAAREEFPDVAFIHAEVYASAAEVEADGLQAPLAPVVDELGFAFEPDLLLIGADGTLARRLDVIYDEVELRDGLSSLTA
ncbi:hypothetical protein PO878_18870 [Iamia majanohamensis]|uniref:Thioredoxin domain-containing protein n=1 Tax=Iamia majanohamensis TaxID=467976 RepID=A0AAF0BV96_9ACTN|nr:hypothetical protein [Iamia majanohamensis]WCO66565.1 hypothetical protein PO878_18870 [Iamia majanohamensis]